LPLEKLRELLVQGALLASGVSGCFISMNLSR
jgi:hypothetical protein